MDKSRPVLGAVFSKHNKGFNFFSFIIIFCNDIQYPTTYVQIPRKTSVALKRDRHIPTGWRLMLAVVASPPQGKSDTLFVATLSK